MQEETLTSRQAAAALGVHVQTVNRWCRAGRIPAAYYRAGSRRLGWRVPEAVVRRLALQGSLLGYSTPDLGPDFPIGRGG